MLDFRRHQQGAAMPARREQRRLLGLAGLSALVLILVLQARDAKLWNWIAPQPPAGPLQVGGAADEPANENGPRAERPVLFPGVQPEYLSQVRDNTVFRAAESDAWFHLLKILNDTDATELQKASLGRVGYLQLDQQTDEYRGRLVTLAGTIRKVKRMDAPENAFGIEHYYQLWLQPEARSPQLVVIYSLNVPDDFPPGDELDETATLTGFFFKRWVYQSAGGIVTAPLVLAKAFQWQPKPVEAPAPTPAIGEQIMLAIGTATVLALLTVSYVFVRNRKAQDELPRPAKRVDLSKLDLPAEASPDHEAML